MKTNNVLDFHITECPRDALQGIKDFVPTDLKIKYLNALLKTNFPTIDAGSFVSPRAIPQMKDTAEVLNNLDRSSSNSRLSVIVANKSGIERALAHESVDIMGFPFSISEKFQQLNTNKSRQQAFDLITEILPSIKDSGKQFLLYFSMAFGNPYGEDWSKENLFEWTKKFQDIGIEQINISDTIGVAETSIIKEVFTELNHSFPLIEFGAHFHTQPMTWHDKVEAAFSVGCRKFDGAIQGFGGCPMAKSPLVGNMPTEKLISFAAQQNLNTKVNTTAFESAYNVALEIFNFYH